MEKTPFRSRLNIWPLRSPESDVSVFTGNPPKKSLSLSPAMTEERSIVFKWGRQSLGLLNGVHPKHGRMKPVRPRLAAPIIAALEYSPIDITVLRSTLRTYQEQLEFVEQGRSQTMNSKHLPDDEGFVNAVDLGAIVNGKLVWDSEHYFSIAKAVQIAAISFNVDIIWGGCWKSLNTERSVEVLHREYVDYKKSIGGRAFFDGPHFQLN